ncbi:hypothetical protein EX30DRAFT_292023, partial [Ascodesmis nigricans]
IQANETWTRIKLHGVSLERYYQPIENKEGLEKLTGDIKNAYPTIDMPTNPKWLLRAEKLEERSHMVAYSSVIITLRNKKGAEWICGRGLWIYGKYHSADKFLSAGPDAFCETCSGWGHAAHRCERATKPACMLCGEEHLSKEHRCLAEGCGVSAGKVCKHLKRKCCNCGDNHTAKSDEC